MSLRGEIAARIALVLASILVSLAALELGVRLWRGGPSLLLHWPNRVAEAVHGERVWPVCSHVYDAAVGWVPNPGFASPGFNVDAQGFRRQPPVADARLPILAVGDSFTAGDEVDDHESWPAVLQEMLARRAINGGVSGYGVDQMVLRAEQVSVREKPAATVLSFIADDLERNARSRMWTLEKPWFEMTDGRLTLHRTPPEEVGCNSLPFWRQAFGWSMLVETVVQRLRLNAVWFYEDRLIMPAGTGWTLGCPLIERLKDIGVPLLVVLQYGRDEWRPNPRNRPDFSASHRVLECAARSGVAVLDTLDVLEGPVAARGLDAVYREGHHSPEGNQIVAEAIAAALARRDVLPSGLPVK